jgi:hypothetical protein
MFYPLYPFLLTANGWSVWIIPSGKKAFKADWFSGSGIGRRGDEGFGVIEWVNGESCGWRRENAEHRRR